MDIYILPEAHLRAGRGPESATSERVTRRGRLRVPARTSRSSSGASSPAVSANPDYWGGKPAVDEVVLRKFNNADAMVAALKSGEIDAVQGVPAAA